MRYEIFQIDSKRECDYSFESWKYAKEKFNIKDYRYVYYGSIDEGNILDGEMLDQIFEKFNVKIPDDFEGHSLSISDIVVLIDDDENRKSYYCDSYGWENITSIVKYQEAVDYLRDELKDQRKAWLMGNENHYGYLYMICNDLGLTTEGQ